MSRAQSSNYLPELILLKQLWVTFSWVPTVVALTRIKFGNSLYDCALITMHCPFCTQLKARKSSRKITSLWIISFKRTLYALWRVTSLVGFLVALSFLPSWLCCLSCHRLLPSFHVRVSKPKIVLWLFNHAWSYLANCKSSVGDFFFPCSPSHLDTE